MKIYHLGGLGELCWIRVAKTRSRSRNYYGAVHKLRHAEGGGGGGGGGHCAKNVVYDSVYFCVYFAYTINIPRVVYITNIHLVYFKNPQVTIIHCAYSRNIKNTQTTMNLQIR